MLQCESSYRGGQGASRQILDFIDFGNEQEIYPQIAQISLIFIQSA